MQSKPDIFEGYARECLKRATLARDGGLRTLFLDLARQWGELAETARNLANHDRDREQFYKSGSQSPGPGIAP
jgi:hypothetical protein